MSRKRLTQQERILKVLREGGSLTQAEAKRRGIKSLSSQVNKLRRQQVRIDSVPQMGRFGRTVVRYQLAF